MKDNSRPDSSLAGLRSAALVALLIGAVGSIGLLRRAQEHPPPIVVAGFVVWVLAPFVFLGLANFFAARWTRRSQIALYLVSLVSTLASLAIYLDDKVAHRTAKRAFVYVAVPPAVVLLSAIVIAVVALTATSMRK